MTDLWNALSVVSRTFDIANPFVLETYARADPHGGYHAAYDDGFPSGSLWRVEGQFLYALIRALKPVSVLELGTWHGASATHILQALHDNNKGSLDCVDNRAYGNIAIGGMIPPELRSHKDDLMWLTFYPTSLEIFIEAALAENTTYDLIFEDAMHTVEQVELVWGMADRLLNPGGVIISHDAMHPIAGPVIREGIARAGYADRALTVLIEPADCGFAVWRKGL